jgi:hypothetical protein
LLDIDFAVLDEKLGGKTLSGVLGAQGSGSGGLDEGGPYGEWQYHLHIGVEVDLIEFEELVEHVTILQEIDDLDKVEGEVNDLELSDTFAPLHQVHQAVLLGL